MQYSKHFPLCYCSPCPFFHSHGLHTQIQERSPRFFPVLKARCFKHDNDETGIRLARMEDNVQKILDRFENEVSSVCLLFPSFLVLYRMLDVYTYVMFWCVVALMCRYIWLYGLQIVVNTLFLFFDSTLMGLPAIGFNNFDISAIANRKYLWRCEEMLFISYVLCDSCCTSS